MQTATSDGNNAHAKTNGFNKQTMQNRLDRFKGYPPKGDWRRDDRLTLCMTLITQTWEYDGKVLLRRMTIAPWGMRSAMERLLSEDRCKRMRFLPKDVKSELSEPQLITYDPRKMILFVSNSGPSDLKEYVRLYCVHCQSTLLPKMFDKYRTALSPDP